MKETIRSNVFADSTSKQKWSFSKSRRFLQQKNSTVGYYSTPSSLDGRSVSFGVGQRISLADKSKINVDPAKYSVPSVFDKKKGFSFGTGRDQTKFQNYLKMLSSINTSANYKIDDSILHKGKAFSIKERTQYPPNYFLPNDPQQQRLSKLPSPSTYETIDSFGEKCVSSKKKNIGYRFSNGQRFGKMKTLQVGPGSYDDRTIRADGQYVLSNMRSSGRRTIFKGKKLSIFDKNQKIPGPGEYDVLGDFGQIIKKQTIQTTSQIRQIKGRPQTARH